MTDHPPLRRDEALRRVTEAPSPNEPLSREAVLERIVKALKSLDFSDVIAYGEIVIKVVKGRPEWVEVHEKTRVG